jgi:hypothetical protein
VPAQSPEATPTTTLLGVGRTHWRQFAPAWAFPVFVFYGSALAEQLNIGGVFYWVFVIPLFYWSFFRASKPWLSKSAPYLAVVFWAMVVPFLVWGATVFSNILLFG